jgi:hypothetical protein
MILRQRHEVKDSDAKWHHLKEGQKELGLAFDNNAFTVFSLLQ